MREEPPVGHDWQIGTVVVYELSPSGSRVELLSVRILERTPFEARADVPALSGLEAGRYLAYSFPCTPALWPPLPAEPAPAPEGLEVVQKYIAWMVKQGSMGQNFYPEKDWPDVDRLPEWARVGIL